MAYVADREKDSIPPAAVVHFHISGMGIRDREDRKEWLCYEVFPNFIGRLNGKYNVNADPKEFSRRHYASGWETNVLSESWLLEVPSQRGEKSISLSMRSIKKDQKVS